MLAAGATPAGARPASAFAISGGGRALIPASAPHAEPPIRLQSAELFRRHREVLIEHAGRTYRLRITGQGKLILTA